MSDELLNTIAEELHKPVRKRFPRRRVITSGIDEIWALDLIQLDNISQYNDGYNYILIVIDCFSRFV